MIRQPYTAAIAMRYLRSGNRNAFISFISAVSMLGIALSVAVLIVVMSVINGFESELERRILSMVPNAMLYGYQDGFEAPVEDWPLLRSRALERADVLAAAPFVDGNALLSANGNSNLVRVRGIDPALEQTVTSIDSTVTEGSLDALADGWNIALGRTLAEELGVAPGDSVTVHTPNVRVTLVGAVQDSSEFTVTAILDVGMEEFDRGLALLGFDKATRLYRMGGRASGISIKVDEVYAARRIVNEFGTALLAEGIGDNYIPEDWAYRHSNIFRSIELTRPVLFIVLSLVMAIAAFNIVSTLFMVVREKRGDIAILRSIGSAPRNILNIFFVQGSAIGLIGTLAGLVLGLALAASLGTIVGWVESLFAIDLLSAEVYMIGDLPTEPRMGEVVRICLMAFVLAVVAALYPAIRAARQAPAEILRHE